MRSILTSIFILLAISGWAQVELNERLDMTGATDAERQLKGLGNPSAAGDAVNVQTVQKGELIYAQASGTDTILVNLSPGLSSYVPGTLINFKAGSSNTGAAVINANGLGYVSIKKGVNQSLDSADIKADQLVSVIYDGTSFQVISTLNRACPNGFVSAGRDYCIETNERALASWWLATVTCMNKNARLCTMIEWSNACNNAGLGLNDMINNFEWVDSAANNATTSKTVGMDPFGVPGCDYGYNASPGLTRNFRCCFSK